MSNQGVPSAKVIVREQEADPTIKRTHKFVPAVRIKRLIEGGITHDQLAEQFGNTPGVVRGWIVANKAPKWTALAVEAIERRMGKGKSSSYLLVKIQNKESDLITRFLESFGASVHKLDI